jgi:hypothetical protein
MITLSELSSAARANDHLAAAGVPLDEILIDLNLEPSSLIRAAEQRALRVALLHDGWSELEIDALGGLIQPRTVRVEEATNFWMPTFTALVIDGAAMIRRAEREFSSRA